MSACRCLSRNVVRMDTLAAPDSGLRSRYTPAHPVSLSKTLAPLSRGGDGPCFRRTATGVWLTFRTPTGAATLQLEQRSDGIDAAAWGDGAEWAIDGLPELLGSRDTWDDLDLSSSPLLTEVRRRNEGLRLSRNRLVFEMLVPAVLEQKVTVVEAWRAWRILVRRHRGAAGAARRRPAVQRPPQAADVDDAPLQPRDDRHVARGHAVGNEGRPQR